MKSEYSKSPKDDSSKLGNTTSNWVSSSLKYEAHIEMGQSPNSDECNTNGIGFPFLQGNAEFGTKSPSPNQFCEKPKKIANKSELLFSVRAPVGAQNIADQAYGIGRGLCSIMARSRLSQEFLWWLMLISKSDFDSIATGSTFESVSSEQVGNLSILLPPLPEQIQIAKFLDHETAKMDRLIQKQQDLIALLQEKRQAVISHAVTKGLNPDAPMKDSGVEWLGEVPAHWAVTKIGHYSKIVNGSTPDKNNLKFWSKGNISWMASGCLSHSFVIEPSEFITQAAFERSSLEIIPKGSLLVGMVGQGKTRGSSAVLGIDSCINQNMAAVIPHTPIKTKYLYYTFQAMYEDLRELGRGGNQAALNCEIIRSIKIPLPNLEEQIHIVSKLDHTLDLIINTINRSNAQIELLKERRTALISAAVTGKIDVRNWDPESV